MTPPQHRRLTELFERVMHVPSEEREDFASRNCEDDPVMLAKLLELVRSAARPTDTFDEPVARVGSSDYRPAFSPEEILLRRFRIIRFLGHGGMGEVYEAEDFQTGRIALKTVRPEIAAHPQILARFRHEVQCARQVTGRNVCRIHELFLLPGSAGRPATAFLTMEFLEGVTLSDRISNSEPLSIQEAEKIAVQICQGLQTIHEAEIIHRDLKSRNIMLAERKGGTEAVLMDFGLAREAHTGSAEVTDGSDATMAGAVVGTPQYMAPEQFQGGKVTPAADIYALGVVLYEMVTGKLPFGGSTPLAAAVERAKPVAAVSSIRPDMPHRWDNTIARCLRYRPEERFQSATEVAGALSARTQWPVLAREYAVRHRRITVFAAVAVAAILATIAFFWYRSRAGSAVPLEAQRWYDQGTAALREGTYLKAAMALERAIDLDKTFVLAHARLADAWNELDFASKAKDEMLEASAIESRGQLSALDQQYVEAIRHTIVRDFPAALQNYQGIVKALPAEMQANGYVDLGRAHENAGNIDQAIASYSAAAKLDSQSPAAFVRLGVLESRRKQTSEAEAAFSKAESLYHASSNLEGIAEIEFERGNDANTRLQLGDARNFLQESLQAAKAIPSLQLEIRALTRMSVTEYLGGNTDQSIALAKQAIGLAEENGIEYWAIDGRVRLGNAYIVRSDYSNAESQLERALSLAQRGQHPRLVALAQLSLSSIRAQQHKPDEVIPLAKAALDYYRSMGFASESVDALTQIVRAQRDQDDNQAAVKSGQELLAFANKLNKPAAVMRAEDAVGSVLLDLERYPEALEHFQRALAASRVLNSGVEYYLLHYANTSWRLGDYGEAERALQSLPAKSRSRPDIAVGVAEIDSAMLMSQKRYAAAMEIVRPFSADKSNVDPGYFERMMCEIETASGSPSPAEDWCRMAVAQAHHESDPLAAAAAELALANAYLSAGSAAQALPTAQGAHDFFAASGQKESEYLSLLSLAKISRALKDSANERQYAHKGLDILSSFEHNWSPQQFRAYSSRVDVRESTAALRRLEE
jgi:tetratricopeptide (TPR) repeat protein